MIKSILVIITLFSCEMRYDTSDKRQRQKEIREQYLPYLYELNVFGVDSVYVKSLFVATKNLVDTGKYHNLPLSIKFKKHPVIIDIELYKLNFDKIHVIIKEIETGRIVLSRQTDSPIIFISERFSL